MNIWMNKEYKEDVIGNYEYIFDILSEKSKSNVTTDIEKIWKEFQVDSLDSIYEDLLMISMSIFCSDKKVIRKKTCDAWTRKIKINIPVIEIEKWNSVKDKLEKMFNFLSGDIWEIVFRKSSVSLRKNKKKKDNNMKKYKAVSLFSGGLDSFCGALKLMKEGIDTCFVGFREYNSVSNKQIELYEAINEEYKEINKKLILFNVKPKSPLDIDGNKIKLKTEDTSRSRSFLFLAGAISVASLIDEAIPVYIPENGFIGINVPLTDSRSGSCSTRTTHVYFLKLFNNILNEVGIKNNIINFYAYKSKGEMVEEHKSNPVFKKYFSETISCSHPCLCRYDKYKTPMNCGYCYPCLIRRASLNDIEDECSNYNPNYILSKQFIDKFGRLNGKASDFKAVLLSLRKYLENKNDDNYIKYILLKQGILNNDELNNYLRVYKKSMNELLKMIIKQDKKNSGGLLEYLGYTEEDIDE